MAPIGQIELQWFAERGAIARQILARDRAAQPLEIDRDLTPDIAAIEIVEAGMSQVIERFGEFFLLEDSADFGDLAVEQESRRKAVNAAEVVEMLLRQPPLAARDRIAVVGMGDGGGEQIIKRQPGAERLG